MPTGQSLESSPTLPTDFADRLERSLPSADSERRRRAWITRVRRSLPLVLLVGPLLAWRLMLSTPDGVHVTVSALAWTTFVLDLGVHVDTSVLSYLGLSQLPSIIGALLMLMLSVSLLWKGQERL